MRGTDRNTGKTVRPGGVRAEEPKRSDLRKLGILSGAAAAITFWTALRIDRVVSGWAAAHERTGYLRDTLRYLADEGVPWALWLILLSIGLLLTAVLWYGTVRHKDTKDKLGRRFRHPDSDEYGGAHFETPEEYSGIARISDVRSPGTTGTIFGQLTDNGEQVIEWIKDGNRKNEHVLIFGASGTGKTYVWSKNYAYQKFRSGESLVIADPDGGMERELRGMAMDFGYDVKSLNFNDFSRSHGWDCMQSLRNSQPEKVDELSQIFANTVIRNVSAEGKDPIYTEGPMSLLRALVLRVWLGNDFPPEEKNIKTVYKQLMQPDLEKYLDNLFLEESLTPEERLCLYPWRAFNATSKNLRGNLMSGLAIKLQLLQGEALSTLLSTDEIDLEALGQRKCVYFCQFPDNNSTYDFVVSLFFSMLIQTLVNLAYRQPDGRLPVPVNFLMEEFPSIGVLSDWSRAMSTVRKRNINIVMIIQDLTQLQHNYEDTWVTILGNCATWISIGINDPDTAAIISERIGESTISVETRNYSPLERYVDFGLQTYRGGAGRRSLLSASELFEIDEDDILILFQGHNPIVEHKFPHQQHPFYRIYLDHEKDGEYPDPLGPMPPLNDAEARRARLHSEELYRQAHEDALPTQWETGPGPEEDAGLMRRRLSEFFRPFLSRSRKKTEYEYAETCDIVFEPDAPGVPTAEETAGPVCPEADAAGTEMSSSPEERSSIDRMEKTPTAATRTAPEGPDIRPAAIQELMDAVPVPERKEQPSPRPKAPASPVSDRKTEAPAAPEKKPGPCVPPETGAPVFSPEPDIWRFIPDLDTLGSRSYRKKQKGAAPKRKTAPNRQKSQTE